jgi:hypothetical protein
MSKNIIFVLVVTYSTHTNSWLLHNISPLIWLSDPISTYLKVAQYKWANTCLLQYNLELDHIPQEWTKLQASKGKLYCRIINQPYKLHCIWGNKWPQRNERMWTSHFNKWCTDMQVTLELKKKTWSRIQCEPHFSLLLLVLCTEKVSR